MSALRQTGIFKPTMLYLKPKVSEHYFLVNKLREIFLFKTPYVILSHTFFYLVKISFFDKLASKGNATASDLLYIALFLR